MVVSGCNARMAEETAEDMLHTCNTCGRGRDGLNHDNWKKHTDACQKKESQKIKDEEVKEERKKQHQGIKGAGKRKNVSTLGCSSMTKFFKPICSTSTPVVSSETFSPVYSPPKLSSILSVPTSASTSTTCSSSIDETDFITETFDTQDEVEIIETEPEPVQGVVHEDIQELMKFLIDKVAQRVNLKCCGFKVGTADIYCSIACHQLAELDIVIEDQNLHHISCVENCYITNDGNIINDGCNNLKYCTKLQKILDRGKKGIDDPAILKCNNTFLPHDQLSERAKLTRSEREKMQLKLLKCTFRYSKLCATLSLHERFLVSIAENNVLQLQQLVTVALRNNRKISYILSKMMAVIDGIYSPNPSQDDKDLAFIVLKFGGPSLLNILCKAGILLSTSTAYRMAKHCPPIVSSVKDCAGKCYENNVKFSDVGKFMVSLKMDETYVNPMLSYNQRDNEACGVCYVCLLTSKLPHQSWYKIEV